MQLLSSSRCSCESLVNRYLFLQIGIQFCSASFFGIQINFGQGRVLRIGGYVKKVEILVNWKHLANKSPYIFSF